MKRIPKIIFVIILVLTSVGCDQATKAMAGDTLQHSHAKSFLTGVIRLQYAENSGGFLSIGSDLHPLIRKVVTLLVTFIVLLGLIILIFNAHRLDTVNIMGFSLFLAGGCGNSIDRLLNEGKVIDFIILGTETIHTGIFNFADLFITIGVALAIVGNFIEQKRKRIIL